MALNQSLKRCLGVSEALIKDGRKALEYSVRSPEAPVGGRVLSPEVNGECDADGYFGASISSKISGTDDRAVDDALDLSKTGGFVPDAVNGDTHNASDVDALFEGLNEHDEQDEHDERASLESFDPGGDQSTDQVIIPTIDDVGFPTLDGHAPYPPPQPQQLEQKSHPQQEHQIRPQSQESQGLRRFRSASSLLSPSPPASRHGTGTDSSTIARGRIGGVLHSVPSSD